MDKAVGSDREETESKVAYEEECAAWRAEGFEPVMVTLFERDGRTIGYSLWKRDTDDLMSGALRIMVTKEEPSMNRHRFDWRSGAVCPMIGWGPIGLEPSEDQSRCHECGTPGGEHTHACSRP